MKGQAEITEIFLNISMAALMIVIVLMIKPIMEDFSKLLTKESAEIVAKDLAGLITISGAAPHEITINYETEDLYTVDIKDRTVEVKSELVEQTSSSSIGVDPQAHLDNVETFTIQKWREGQKNVYDLFSGLIPIPGATTTIPGGVIPPITGKSKLGFQTQFTKPCVMDFIRKTKPAVVKLMDHFDAASEIKIESPDTFVIGRIYSKNEPTDGDPEQRAIEWFNKNKETIEGNVGFDCWEGYNEPVFNNPEGMEWYSKFEIKRMQLLESIGRKACIGNFATGNPELELWPYFMDALNYATNHGHYLALHEYGNPTIQSDSEWHALRHRKVYNQYGLSLPLVITETGIDTCGREECGWRSTTNANDYLNQLVWYDSKLKEDTYVIGAAIFHYGLHGWDSFEIYPELTGENGLLVSYISGGPQVV